MVSKICLLIMNCHANSFKEIRTPDASLIFMYKLKFRKLFLNSINQFYTIFQGTAINLSNLTSSKTYPLVFGKDAAAKFTPISEARFIIF